MARLPYYEQLADQIDQMRVRIMGGDLDTQLRIAERRAKLRELARLERLEQQEKAQGALPMILPEQNRPGTANDPPLKRKRRSHGPAPATVAKFAAAFAYALSDEPFEESMQPGELGRRIGEFAVKHGLDGAEAVDDVANDSTMRTFMTACLEAVRITRGR